jgi:hypothetical protein
MAIVGVFETELHAGTINTEASFSAQHNFASPLDIWSRPYLQQVSVNDDDGSVILGISQFVDSSGTHNGSFHPGIFAKKCKSVTFAMATTDCIATAILTTEIFG